MKKAFLLLLCISQLGRGQMVFHTCVPNGLATTNKIYPDVGGGYFMCGDNWTVGQPGSPYRDGGFFSRVDALGDMKWSLRFSSAWLVSVRDIISFPGDGSMIAIANYYSSYHFFEKTDSLGNEIWRKQTSLPFFATSGLAVSSSKFVVAGRSNDNALDFVLAKLDTSGTVIWAKKYSKQSTGSNNSVIKTRDNGFFMCGAVGDSTQAYKVDSLGNLTWSKIYGASSPIKMLAARQTSDGGYLMCGGTQVIKTDSAGDVLWCAAYTAAMNDIQIYNDSLYFFCGYSGTKSTLIATHINGIVANATFYSDRPILASAKYSFANSLALTADGGIVLGSSARIPWSGNYDGYQSTIQKTTATGASVCGDSVGLVAKSFFGIGPINAFVTDSSLSAVTSVFAGPAQSLSYGHSSGCVSAIGVKYKDEDQIKIFPDPTAETISITLPLNARSCQIINAIGHVVKELEIKNAQEVEVVNLDAIENGIYFLQVVTEEGRITKKFILNRP